MSIYIGTTQTSAIYNGSTLTSAVYLGNFKTWPTGVVTQTITNTGVAYSSGTYINAAGTNYGYLRGVLNTYIDGTFDSSSYITLTPTFNGSYDSTIWSISGNQVHAADRELVYDANSRSVSVNGRYDSSTFGPFNVWQDHNTYSPTGTGTMIFQLNGQNGTITQDSSAKTWSANTVIQRNVIYTSGHTTTLNEYSQQYYTYTINDNYATVTYSDGTVIQPGNNASHSGATLSTVAIPDNSGTSDRTMTIIARDSMYSNIYSIIAITQYANHEYVLNLTNTSNPLSVLGNATSFDIYVYSSKDGAACSVLSSQVSTSSSWASCTGVSRVGTSFVYRLTFTCTANPSVTQARSLNISINQDGNKMWSNICTVTQAKNDSVFDGITVKSSYVDGNNNTWIIGIYKSGDASIGDPPQSYEVNGVLVACDSQIETDTTVQFTSLAVQRIANIGTQSAAGTTYSVPSGTTQVVPANTSTTLNGVTYYGTWVVLPGVTWNNGWVQGTSNTTLSPHPGTSLNGSGFVVN